MATIRNRMSVRTFSNRQRGPNWVSPGASRTRPGLALLVGAVSALGVVTPGGASAAGAATAVRIYVQAPAASTVQPGAEIDVPIRIDTGGQHVTVVTANFTYPPDRFSFLSFDDSGSAFPLSAAAGAANGLVKISRSVPGTTGVSGDLLVTTAKFRAGPSTGTAALCFSDTDRVLRTSDGADVLGAKTATTYTVGSPSALSLGCLSRNYLAQGAQHSVTLTGRGFAAGMTVAVSGTGVTASRVNVTSAYKATAFFKVSPWAPNGTDTKYRDITVTTGAGAAVCRSCLTIGFGPKLSADTTSVTVPRGASNYPVELRGSNFGPQTQVTIGGSGVTITSRTWVSHSQINLTVSVASGAATGNRPVRLYTPYQPSYGYFGRGSCGNCLSVS